MEREYAQLVSRIAPLEEKLSEMTSSRERIDVDLSQEEARFEELRGSMSDVEKRLAEAQRDASLHMEKVNRVEQKNLVAAERTKALASNITRYEREKEELKLEKMRLQELVLVLERRLREQKAGTHQLVTDMELRRSEWAEASQFLEKKKTELTSLNERNLALVQGIAEKQSEQDRLRGRIENLNGRSQHASGENQSYADELLALAQEVEEHSTEDRQLRRSFAQAEMKYYDAEKSKKELQQQLDTMQREEMEILGEVQRRKARIDFLERIDRKPRGILGERSLPLPRQKDGRSRVLPLQTPCMRRSDLLPQWNQRWVNLRVSSSSIVAKTPNRQSRS